jgi:hypothetical protein
VEPIILALLTFVSVAEEMTAREAGITNVASATISCVGAVSPGWCPPVLFEQGHLVQKEFECDPTDEMLVRERQDTARYMYELSLHVLARAKSHLRHQAVRIGNVRQYHTPVIKVDLYGSVPPFVPCCLVHARIAIGDIGRNVNPIVPESSDAVNEFLLLRSRLV